MGGQDQQKGTREISGYLASVSGSVERVCTVLLGSSSCRCETRQHVHIAATESLLEGDAWSRNGGCIVMRTIYCITSYFRATTTSPCHKDSRRNPILHPWLRIKLQLIRSSLLVTHTCKKHVDIPYTASAPPLSLEAPGRTGHAHPHRR